MKTRIVLQLAGALLTICLVPAALATDDGILDRRISLNLNKAPTSALPPLFAQLLGADVEIEFAAEGNVSLVFDDITVRTSLNAYCESVGCRWELDDGDPPRLRFLEDVLAERLEAEEQREVPRDLPISLDLTDAPAHQVFGLAAEILGAEPFLDPLLKEHKITIECEEEPIEELLDEMCAIVGCRWTLSDDDPPRLSVVIEDGPV
jgi:hypothetical protein